MPAWHRTNRRTAGVERAAAVSPTSQRIPMHTSRCAPFAEHLSINQRTVMKWIKAVILAGYRFQTEWRILTANAIAFVERNRFQPDAPD